MQASMITQYLKGLPSSTLIQLYPGYRKVTMFCTTVGKVSGVFTLVNAGIGIGFIVTPKKYYSKDTPKDVCIKAMLLMIAIGSFTTILCFLSRHTHLLAQERVLEILKSREVTQLPT